MLISIYDETNILTVYFYVSSFPEISINHEQSWYLLWENKDIWVFFGFFFFKSTFRQNKLANTVISSRKKDIVIVFRYHQALVSICYAKTEVIKFSLFGSSQVCVIFLKKREKRQHSKLFLVPWAKICPIHASSQISVSRVILPVF